ncbi:adenylyltransferase/cytidyltransferase family protein [Candidatus Pacearchaeota archaeon]|nr:adenylyltransferase/cytidyltransferase family protein [Candidatus Pacearchaeota archaeon]
MVFIGVKDLTEIRKKFKDKKIVFCSGTFDLIHAGHVLFFEDCKKLGDILVVAVGNDNLIKKYKGKNRPIINERARLKMIDAIKPVDFCLIDLPVLDNDLFSPIMPILEKLRPDIWAVNDDAFDIPLRNDLAKKYLIELKILKRYCPQEFGNISTTNIINKIKDL